MSRLPIRALLFALVSAVVIPVTLMLAYSIYSDAQLRVAEAKYAARTLAKVTATDVSRKLTANQELMQQMAKRPLIRAVDATRCDPVLWDFRELFPRYANATVVDINGVAICSAVPQPGGKPVSVAKTEWFKRIVAENRFVVGKPFIGPITGRWVSVLAYPIRDDQEKMTGLIGLPIDLALYEPNVSTASLIPHTTVGVVTAEGTLVWRNLEAEKWVGKNVKDLGNVEQILALKDGEMEGVGVDAIARFYAIASVPGSDWYAFVGIPTSSVYEQVRATLMRNSILGLLSLLGILGFALLISRRIEHPVRALATVARAVKNGNHEVRAPAEGPPEIVEVAQEFNEMLDVRFQAEESVRQLNQSLETRVQEEAAKNREKDLLLIQQSRLATMGEMMHNVAHQWRQPLTSLALLLTNIGDDYAFGELTKEKLDKQLEIGRRLTYKMSATIDDFRNFFRPDQERVRFNLKKSVQDALNLVDASFQNNDIEVSVEAPQDIYSEGYANEFSHVLLNILANAKDAIQAKDIPGKVLIKLEPGEGGLAVIKVIDNGGGFPTGILPKIFDPYFTTKENGSGIGLYMSKMIMEHMKGRIEAHNIENGAEFVISIPEAKAEV